MVHDAFRVRVEKGNKGDDIHRRPGGRRERSGVPLQGMERDRLSNPKKRQTPLETVESPPVYYGDSKNTDFFFCNNPNAMLCQIKKVASRHPGFSSPSMNSRVDAVR